MRRVLIVDDDTIVRITLHSLVDWEGLGYQIAADAIHGEQALARMKEQPVDLVITDMKMPVMDGIGLLEQINRMAENRELPVMPKVLVLSGYDDFQLVRESFRLGAEDYLLKADLNEEMLLSMLERFKDEWSQEEVAGERVERGEESGLWGVHNLDGTFGPVEKDSPGRTDGIDAGEREFDGSGENKRGKASSPSQECTARVAEIPKDQLLVDMAMGKREIRPGFFPEDYVVIQFEIEDFLRHSGRFGGDVEESLVKPVLEFAGQIPRVVSKCVLGSISPSRYVMLYQVGDMRTYQDTVVSTCRQLRSVWSNYMNLPVSCGISSAGHSPEEFGERFEEAGHQLALHCLKGKAQICFPWEPGTVRYEDVERTGAEYEKLLKGLMVGDELAVEEEKKRLFASCYTAGVEAARTWCLHLICRLAWQLQDNHDDISALFADEVDYYTKLGRLDEVRSLELWMNNYFRWVTDYMQHHHDRRQADLIIRAKRFIMDNYANPELTLGSVAGYIGLNEKYFSSRFTKEEGMTFSNYLTEVRIRKAKELMEQTDLKVYEISQSVGYNSVEHFTRVFKKLCHVSPGGYRK